MPLELMMGNAAVAHGALRAGVNVVCGYPGTPSTEVLETVAAQVQAWAQAGCAGGSGEVHVEWSVNEKAALEVAAGAAMCGARALVTMKQVGLNVASDPLMTLSYLGCEGGLVLYVADDPGPISSQTEQDTRQFAPFAKVPILDPSTPEEAWQMVQDAFEISEKFKLPVIVRSTTRICHGSAAVEPVESFVSKGISGFIRDPHWVTFPPLAYKVHAAMPKRTTDIATYFNNYWGNKVCDLTSSGSAGAFDGSRSIHSESFPDSSHARIGIAASGISWAYLLDALAHLNLDTCDASQVRLLKMATCYPFPDECALSFLEGLERVIVFEELEACVERELLRLVGRHHLRADIFGKLTGHTLVAGENSVDVIHRQVTAFFEAEGIKCTPFDPERSELASPMRVQPELEPPALIARPPVLCAGCPHRASFAAVKRALRFKEYTCSGDIGCYTLANALPLDMVDTCVCMGAGFTVPQGMHWAQPSVKHLGFVGDSTFFASSITGVINALYNQAPVTLFVLDNSITAMTGAQHHPGTGIRMSFDAGDADKTHALSIPAILRALGVPHVVECDPFDFAHAIESAREAIEFEGVSAVVYKAPCVTLTRPESPPLVNEKCTLCRTCINQLGCPAIRTRDHQLFIDDGLCAGCNLCVQVCPLKALESTHG